MRPPAQPPATSPPASLTEALLAELAAHPGGVALPVLCKRLRVRMSVLLRTLAWLGETPLGEIEGAGWVRVMTQGERSVVALTEAGRLRFADPGADVGVRWVTDAARRPP